MIQCSNTSLCFAVLQVGQSVFSCCLHATPTTTTATGQREWTYNTSSCLNPRRKEGGRAPHPPPHLLLNPSSSSLLPTASIVGLLPRHAQDITEIRKDRSPLAYDCPKETIHSFILIHSSLPGRYCVCEEKRGYIWRNIFVRSFWENGTRKRWTYERNINLI